MKESHQKAITLYKAGLSQEAIGSIIGYHPSSVGKLLRSHNIPIRPNTGNSGKGKPIHNKARIIALLRSGLTRTEVAEVVNCQVQVVHRVAQELRVKKRHPSVESTNVRPTKVKKLEALYEENKELLRQSRERWLKCKEASSLKEEDYKL